MTRQDPQFDTARKAFNRALAESRVPGGCDPDAFREILGKQRSRRLDAYLARQHQTLEQTLRAVQGQPAPETLIEALCPQPGKQARAERAYLDKLQGGLSPLFFRNGVQPLPRHGRGMFVPCPGVSRSADAFGRVDDVGYVFVHKCSNHGGGAQDMAQAELERIALAATFPEGRYDGFVLRSPERVLLRAHQAFETRKTVLVLLQDGMGREADMAHLQKLCAHANLHPSLFVFAGTTEEFLLMQPMLHAHMVGAEALTAGQALALATARSRFAERFPSGFNGF